jgi:hypothetical protein
MAARTGAVPGVRAGATRATRAEEAGRERGGDVSDGNFTDDWKPTASENPAFRCTCGSNNVWYRCWESSCGGFEDVKYECRTCGRVWWVESADG